MTRDDIRPPANEGYRSDDRTQTDALDRAWDERLRPRSPRTSPSSIPPARARMLDQIQALAARDAAVAPDTRARIWHSTRVMAGIPAGRSEDMAMPTAISPDAIPARPSIRLSLPRSSTGRAATRRRRSFWPVVQVIAAAALILAIVGTVGDARHDGGLHGVFVGGATDTPTGTATSPESGVTLQHWNAMATLLPTESATIALFHLDLRTGSPWKVTASSHAPVTVMALAVSGTADLYTADDPSSRVGLRSATTDDIDARTGSTVSLETNITPAELYVVVVGNGVITYHLLPMYGNVQLLGTWSGPELSQTSGHGLGVSAPIALDLRVRQIANGDGETLGSASGSQVAMLTPLSGEATLVRSAGDVQVQQASDDRGGTPTAVTTRTISANAAVTAAPGGAFHITSSAEPVTYLALTATSAPSIAPDSATPATEQGTGGVSLTADFPANTPLTTEFYRVGLNHNSTWHITPGPNGPLAVLAYAAAGSATLTTPGSAPVTVGTAASAIGTTTNPSQAVSLVGNGVTITTSSRPASIYLAVINHGPQNFDLTTVPGSVVFLGVSADRSLVQPTGAGQGTRSVRVALSQQQLAGGASDTLAADSGLLMLSPLDGTIDLTGRAGDVFVRPGAGPDTATPAAAEPIPLTADTSVSAQPGSQIQIAAGDAPVTYLLLQVVPVATPATPAAGSTPAGAGATPAP